MQQDKTNLEVLLHPSRSSPPTLKGCWRSHGLPSGRSLALKPQQQQQQQQLQAQRKWTSGCTVVACNKYELRIDCFSHPIKCKDCAFGECTQSWLTRALFQAVLLKWPSGCVLTRIITDVFVRYAWGSVYKNMIKLDYVAMLD